MVIVVGHALTLILERRIVEVPPAPLLALVFARRWAERRLEVVGRVGAEDSDRQLVGVADEVRPRRAAAAARQDETRTGSAEDRGVRMTGDVARQREQRRRTTQGVR